VDEEGIARRGVLLRHLVMPDDAGGTRDIMTWVAQELGANTYVNVMAQYWPSGQASSFPEIARGITGREFTEGMESARTAGLRRFDPRT
jgi:putative pyruvate formate lyase activating enzyme